MAAASLVALRWRIRASSLRRPHQEKDAAVTPFFQHYNSIYSENLWQIYLIWLIKESRFYICIAYIAHVEISLVKKKLK